MGFISGTLKTRPNTVLYVFDQSGEFSIGVIPIEPIVETWEAFADHVILAELPESGE